MQSSQTILTRDGTRIWISVHTPQKDNGRVIVIAPGFGIAQRFYHLFACYFRIHGFTVISFDYRGIGQSAPKRMRMFRANLHEWAVLDINAVLLYAKQQYKQYEIIYIGHSIGGELIGLAPASQYINRMVLVSTALTCEKHWPWYHRIRLKANKAFSRVAGWLLGYSPGGSGIQKEALPRGVSDQMANWCDSDNGLFDAFPDNNYRKLNVPVLAYSFTDDWLCPPRAVKELLNHFTNASITWHHLRPKEIGIRKIGHINFFHVSMKSVLWRSLQKWLNDEGGNPVRQDKLNIKRNLQ